VKIHRHFMYTKDDILHLFYFSSMFQSLYAIFWQVNIRQQVKVPHVLPAYMNIHRRYTHKNLHSRFILYTELLDRGHEMPKPAGEVKDLESPNLSVCSRFTLAAD
jgi:hypothetical protein